MSPLASHIGMIDFMVMSLLCGTLQCMVLRIEKYHNWGTCISFVVQSYAKSTSGTFDLYLASENGGRLIEWEDHCKERCLKKDRSEGNGVAPSFLILYNAWALDIRRSIR